MPVEIVVIGASLGGFNALGTLLGRLPATFPVPIAVAQHRAPQSGEPLKTALQRRTPLRVREAEDKDALVPGRVYIAPADYHLLVERGMLFLSTEGLVSNARPSLDVLFESAADAYGSGVVAVVLTGANHDGARGAAEVKRRGGTILVQDPATAESAVMPKAALAAAPTDHVASVPLLADLLLKICLPSEAPTHAG